MMCLRCGRRPKQTSRRSSRRRNKTATIYAPWRASPKFGRPALIRRPAVHSPRRVGVEVTRRHAQEHLSFTGVRVQASNIGLGHRAHELVGTEHVAYFLGRRHAPLAIEKHLERAEIGVSEPVRHSFSVGVGQYGQAGLLNSPPSTHRVWPVTKSAASLAKNATTRPTSRGVPTRPSGVNLAQVPA